MKLLLARVARLRHASAAVLAQLTQALASFVLQVIAVRDLGSDGFGVFALLYSGLILATAVVTGLVGDSLTVLERRRPEIRGGLVVTGLGACLVAGTVSIPVTLGFNLLDTGEAVLFGVVVAAFIVEELLRRILMANLRFWFVLMVDGTAFVGALASVLLFRVAGGGLTMWRLLLSLLIGQTLAMVVGIISIPRAERGPVHLRSASVLPVFRYGSWRAAQQSVRPGTLTLMRGVIVAATGISLFGELETARVYTAPAMLLVNGIGAYLFASYAKERDASLTSLIRKADAGAGMLVLLTLVLGGAAVVLLPIGGPLVTDGDFKLNAIAVYGWSVYAAASATLMPYASLAAVRGRHVLALGVRLVEAVVSLTVLAITLFLFHIPIWWAPYAVSTGAVVCGVIVRQWILVPQALRDDREADKGSVAGAPVESLFDSGAVQTGVEG